MGSGCEYGHGLSAAIPLCAFIQLIEQVDEAIGNSLSHHIVIHCTKLAPDFMPDIIPERRPEVVRMFRRVRR